MILTKQITYVTINKSEGIIMNIHQNKIRLITGVTCVYIFSLLLFILFFISSENGIIHKFLPETNINNKGVSNIPVIAESEMNEDEMIEQYKTFLQSPYFIIVNKNHPIPEGYQIDLSPLKNTNITMEKEAASQFNAFLQAVEDAGISYRILDGFRAADMQQTLYDDEYKKNLAAGYSGDSTIAAKTALNVAPVGFSEHQTGLAVDITQTGQKVTSEVLNSDFYKFAKENLYKYGFIIRYPENKKDSTGYDNKPWHFRYIGNVEQAKYITDKNISLEEYIEYLQKKISDYEQKQEIDKNKIVVNS